MIIRNILSGCVIATLFAAPAESIALGVSIPRPKSNRVRGDDDASKKAFYTNQHNQAKSKHPSSSSSSAKYQSYKTPRLGLSFSYPASWDLDDNQKWIVITGVPKKLPELVRGQPIPVPPFVFISRHLVRAANTSSNPPVSERIDQNFYNRMTFHETEIGIDYYLPSFKPDAPEDALLLGQPARRYTYTGERDSRPIRGQTIATIIGDMYYAVSLQSDPVYFEDVMGDFTSLVESLRSTDAQQSSKSSKSSKKVSSRSPRSSKSSVRASR